MFKTFLEFLETKGYKSQEEFGKAADSLKFEIVSQYNTYLRNEMVKAAENSATKAEMSKIEQAIKENVAQNFKTITKVVDDLALKLNKASGVSDNGATPVGSISKSKAKAIVDGFRDAIKQQNDHLVEKAITTTASVNNNDAALYLPDVGQLAHRRLSVLDIFPQFPIGENNNGSVKYYDWDEATKVRAAAMIAEGQDFPESTARFEVYTIKLKKVGDTLPWTDEFEYDDAFLMSELMAFLRTNVNILIDDQMVNGDGLANNLKGLDSSVNTYVPAPAGIVDASIYDLFPKLREAIMANQGSKYNVNVAFMNITDINKYKLKKDANNNYIMPPFVDDNGNIIDGVTVIESNAVAANSMYIGDRNYARVYDAGDVGIEFGWINDDFNKGQKRMRLYRRLLFLIREADKGGWLKVDDITAAVATLAN